MGTSSDDETTPRGARARLLDPPAPRAMEAELVSEMEGALGTVLWQLVRDAKLWATVSADVRGGLFRRPTAASRDALAKAIHLRGELEGPFGVLAALVRFPDLCIAEDLRSACTQIGEWATSGGFLETAVEFAEAAALLAPQDAKSAADAGMACFRAGHYNRAIIWYQRAITLGRAATDWEWLVRARLRLASAYFQLGEYRPARKLCLRAYRAAARKSKRILAAFAHHDLVGVEAEMGNFPLAEKHAAKALELYPRDHDNLPRLAHDYAALLVRYEYHSRALMLLEACQPFFIAPELERLALGTMARALGGLGRSLRFDEIRREMLGADGKPAMFLPAAFLQMAEGARNLAAWDDAEYLAGRALDLAMNRKDLGVHRAALSLLDAITTRTEAPRSREPDKLSVVEQLTREFLRRLRAWRAAHP